MIKSIRLRNFQAHVDTTINFHKGVNAITGKTDSGKTACIRALKWVLTNRPTGDSIVNHSAFVDGKQIAPCIVTIVTDTSIVEREKFGATNKYTGTVGGKNFELDSGVAVPQEVIDALNLDEINSQYQLDMPFLLTETAGEVARMLNKIVKLDDIDSTLKNINGYTKIKAADKKRIEYELAQITEEIDSINLDGITTLVETGELLEEVEAVLVEKIGRIDALDLDIRRVQDSLKQSALTASSAAFLDDWYKLYLSHKEVHQRASTVDTYIKDAKALEAKILVQKPYTNIAVFATDKYVKNYTEIKTQLTLLNSLTTELKKLKVRVNSTKKLTSINTSNTDELVGKLQSTNKNIKVLDTVYNDVVNYTKSLKEGKATIKKEEQEIKEMIGDVCPICGQKVGE